MHGRCKLAKEDANAQEKMQTLKGSSRKLQREDARKGSLRKL